MPGTAPPPRGSPAIPGARAFSAAGGGPLTPYLAQGCSLGSMRERLERWLRIGELAAAAGVNIETVRYYERRGLLPAPYRSLNGYRRYDTESVRVLRFIKRAQALGFTLREVGELLRLRDPRGVPCERVRARAEEKIAEIVSRERQLAAMRRALEELVRSCRRRAAPRECPILDALSDDGEAVGRAARRRRAARGEQDGN